MTNFKSFLTAIAVGSALAISIEQPLLADSLFPSATQYVNQQLESSSTVIKVKIVPTIIELKEDRDWEVVGQLSTPIQIDGIAIPIGSDVRLSVISTEDGDAFLIADSIVIPSNGASVAISAESSVIPVTIITDASGMDNAKKTSSLGRHIGENLGELLSDDIDDVIDGGSGGDLGGTLGGLLNPSKRRVVSLSKGYYLLDLYRP